MSAIVHSRRVLRRAPRLIPYAAAAIASGAGWVNAQDSAGSVGRAHLAAGDYSAARDELDRALERDATSLDPIQTATLLNDLGTAYMALDEPLSGLAAFADARRIAADGTVLAAVAEANVARALEANGATADSPGRLQNIAAAARGLEPSTAQAEIFLSLAELHRSSAPVAEAERAAHLGDAVELAEAARAWAAGAGDDRLLAEAHGALGAAHVAQGSLESALAHTRRAVTLAQSAGSADSLYRWEWQTARLLRARGDVDGAARAYAAAIETLAMTRLATTTSRSGFARDVLPLYEEYADIMLARARTLEPPAAEAALLAVRQTLETLRVAEVRNYFENQCAVPEVLESPAAPRVVVLYPLVFADRTELLVSAGAELRQFTVAVDLPTLTSATRSLRQAIEDPESGDAFLRSAQLLHRWLIEPLDPLLDSAEPTTLIVVPDGPLRTIPFAVLHDGSRFLVERYSLGITPALSLVGAVNEEPISRVLLNGIIEPTRGFPGLPFVAEELESIGERFPSRAYTDERFVTATLEREMVEGGYSVVHMATHAQFASDYRRSFLLAHDDLITMDELEDAIGSQRYSDRPVDLLVLSACSTAEGDERAALGLAGVAVKAGARSALASLWALNDESTALLVAEFYRQLDGGAGKADALRGAQLALINDARYSHAAYWAPFLMIGDWR